MPKTNPEPALDRDARLRREVTQVIHNATLTFRHQGRVTRLAEFVATGRADQEFVRLALQGEVCYAGQIRTRHHNQADRLSRLADTASRAEDARLLRAIALNAADVAGCYAIRVKQLSECLEMVSSR